MYIAIEKRRENIAEYILYLWQLEDLLRALQMSPEAIYSQLVKPQKLTADKEQELLIWYMGIVNLLKEENKEEHGHLLHTLHLISDLHNQHLQLMQLPIGANYRGIYTKLQPELPRLRELLSANEMSDIELCFRALYAVMLYRIKGEKKGSIDDVIEVVSPVIAELVKIYIQVEKGEVDLYKE